MTEHNFQMGDEVLAWDGSDKGAVRGRFVYQYSLKSKYPFQVLLDGGGVCVFKHCKPYTEPAKRPMTHKEVFELMARESVVFMSMIGGVNMWIVSNWDSHRRTESFEYCPIAELVEPLDKSPWRKLEVEE